MALSLERRPEAQTHASAVSLSPRGPPGGRLQFGAVASLCLETCPASSAESPACVQLHVLKPLRWAVWAFQARMAPQNLPSDALTRTPEPPTCFWSRCAGALAPTLYQLRGNYLWGRFNLLGCSCHLGSPWKHKALPLAHPAAERGALRTQGERLKAASWRE